VRAYHSRPQSVKVSIFVGFCLSALPNVPTARGALAAVAVGKKIYVMGGARIPAGTQMPDGLYGGGPVELLGTNEI
jgi:hypothetical protein